MYTGNTVSYKAIMDKQFRDFGFEITDEEGLEWVAEFMAHTKVGVVMDNRICYIPICDGRGELPYDLYKIVQTAKIDCIDTIEQAECGEGVMYPMRWSTDHFHKRYHRDDRDYTTQSQDTYTVENGYIFTSFSNGFVAMSIEAIPTDVNGDPVVPASQEWLEAASHNLAWKKARKLRRTNSIDPNFYMEIMQDRDWYFAQAVNQGKLPQNVDQMESLKNSIVMTIPDIQAHSSFFANLQLPEQRRFRGVANNRVSTTPDKITQSKDNIAP
jgi:hypothetical protein